MVTKRTKVYTFYIVSVNNVSPGCRAVAGVSHIRTFRLHLRRNYLFGLLSPTESQFLKNCPRLGGPGNNTDGRESLS